MTVLQNTLSVDVGNTLKVKYPQHGVRNILCDQTGVVQRVGGNFVTIKKEDGSFRNLRFEKMIQPQVTR